MERRAIRTNNKLAAVTTGIVTSASFFDAFIHAYPKHRFMLGHVIGDHIGNTLYTAAPIIGATFIGDLISQQGIRRHSRALEICGQLLPIIAVAAMAIVNIWVENLPNNYQFTGDVTDGLMTIPLALLATRTAINRFRNSTRNNLAA
jgi:hypothetical protein